MNKEKITLVKYIEDSPYIGSALLCNSEFKPEYKEKAELSDEILHQFEWHYGTQAGYISIKINKISKKISDGGIYTYSGVKGGQYISRSLSKTHSESLILYFKKLLKENNIDFQN